VQTLRLLESVLLLLQTVGVVDAAAVVAAVGEQLEDPDSL
jgi:hypothetical protein